MISTLSVRSCCAVLFVASLAACANFGHPPKTGAASSSASAASAPAPTQPSQAASPSRSSDTSTPVAVSKAAGQSALAEGISLFDNGDYAGSLKKLGGSQEIWRGDKAGQVTALKYMAFSYCVTNRKTQCRKEFQKALKIDPSFDLDAGEKGHPLWGPVFDAIKKKK